MASSNRPSRPALGVRSGVARLAALSASLFLLSGCGGDSPDPAFAQGRVLYQENCVACHGADALGDGPLASTLPVPPPALQEHLGHHTQADLVRLIQSGVPPAMPPTPLSTEEIQQIVDYLWTLVPESEAAGLRERQRAMETGADPATGSAPGAHEMH